MGRFTDFFKALANNPNVIDDKFIENELAEFMQNNSDSAKRVSDMENRLHSEGKVSRLKPIVATLETTDKAVKSKKTIKKDEREER